MKYVLAIDQGTTSSRTMLFDERGKPVATAQKEIQCKYPHSGWVEVDAIDVWLSVADCINEVLVKNDLTGDDIDSIGITNQRETTVVWNKKTGKPIYNAIVWQSRQTTAICESVSDKKQLIHSKTGLIINPYFSASKIRFILDTVPGAQEMAENGELIFGTMDTWVMYKLSKGKIHATDVSNASRTLLYNISTMSWDEELCKIFNIPMSMLPTVNPSSFNYGDTIYGAPITGVLGDQQAALFGQTCFEKGDCKNTYGTGCFMLMNTGDKPTFSNNGLLTTVAWQIEDKVTYALEGSVFVGGAVIQWVRDEMKLINKSSESEDMANSVKNTGGIYIVPAFTGLGTPYWDDDARGAIFGLTRGTNSAQIVRACLESIAYQSKDVFEVMKQETGIVINDLGVDGGATANKYLMQFQSDILETNIKLPACLETTALGVAYMAGLHTGFYKSMDEIKKIHSYQASYSPSLDKSEVTRKYKNWKLAVEATRLFKSE
ncbi:MAG: glycerol kinase GlpK [Bacilli bacterium]|nr:glycerol kinase GlpK [Bacilli bacterium]